jgi:hypothetical protein
MINFLNDHISPEIRSRWNIGAQDEDSETGAVTIEGNSDGRALLAVLTVEGVAALSSPEGVDALVDTAMRSALATSKSIVPEVAEDDAPEIAAESDEG